MKVDYVLILAAGKGTRMGEVGKLLPKVIWPISDKTILELELLYAKKLVPEAKIFINLFNYKEQIYDFIKAKDTFKETQILIEKEKLDIGGAVHNLAKKVGYSGNLLIMNSDQFLYSDTNILEGALSKLDEVDLLLFTFDVNSSDGYNALKNEKGLLKGIIPNAELGGNKTVETYTGMSLIKLDKLKPSQGESNFFKTVANFEDLNIGLSKIENFEYWDFGTTQRYLGSITELYKGKSLFYSFLKEQHCLENIVIREDEFIFGDFKVNKDGIYYKGRTSN